MFLNKKGIAPLIATVLLIGFTVALTGVVIMWGSGFIEKVTSGTEKGRDVTLACTSELKFEIKNVVCDDNGAAAGGASKITIENKGPIKLEGVAIRFFDAGGQSKGSTQTDSVLAFDIKQKRLYPDAAFPNDETKATALIPVGTTKVEGLATIKINDQNITCGEYIQEKAVSLAC